MSLSYINKKKWSLIISFFIILLFVNSCASIKRETFSVPTDLLKQYVGSYQLGPDSIATVSLEGHQLYISSCPLLDLSVSPDIVSRYTVSNRQEPDSRERLIQEVSLMRRSAENKRHPVYAISETKFITKEKHTGTAVIEFVINGEGEVTHFIVEKMLSDRRYLINPYEAFGLGGKDIAAKIAP